MARNIVRYTPEQLQHLRNSHLVQKPDGLPSIDQWMEPQPDQANRRPRSQVLREGEQPANGEARVDRPVLSAMGMGNFGRRPSTQPEDTVLGPPKLSFTSASRNAKPPDGAEKRTVSALDSEGSLADRVGTRERWSKDRFDSVRDKAGYLNGRRGVREEGEGWTNVKSRKSLGQDEMERPHRNGERDRDRLHKDGDLDTGEVGSRRAGLGRGRFDQPWGREDSATKEIESVKSGPRGQGWRDRERDKERDRDPPRDRDRDWNRGRGGIEEDPEWMDTPTVTEKKPARTQEDFQRWKEAQTMKTTKPQDKKESPQEPAACAPEPVQVPVSVSFAGQQKPATPFAMDVGTEKLFGMWGEGKRADPNATENATLSKATKAKPKSSRFAGLFSPPEEPVAKAQAPVETPISPELALNTSTEDKEGFQRVLQMLGSANISAVQPTPTAPLSNDSRPFFYSDTDQALSDEALAKLLRGARQSNPQARNDRQYTETMAAPKPSVPDSRSPAAMFGLHSPENESGPDQYRHSRPESGRPVEDFPFQPPSRNGGAQDLQAIFQGGGRTSQEPSKDSKREFLLTLMQQPSRGTPPQMAGHNLPRQTPDNSSFLPFMDKGPAHPKNRGPPPGMFDDPRMYTDNEMLRREAGMREAGIREANMRDAMMREATIREVNMREAGIREANMREASMREANLHENDPLRKALQRPPPGIYDDLSMSSLTRRNTTENMPRQPTNMGIPQQPVAELPPWMKGPGLQQPSQERNVAPPPGFPPTGMRQPPGFGGPPVGSQPQMPFSASNTPLGHPGMPPPRGMGGPGGMFPGGPPPGPPGGYFGPPGFAPMGIPRDDPRMMMGPPRRPEYDQFSRDPNAPRPNMRPGDMYQM